MRKLEERATAMGHMAQRRKIREIAHQLSEQGVQAEALDNSVVLTGRGLLKRWLNEASLRFITGLTR